MVDSFPRQRRPFLFVVPSRSSEDAHNSCSPFCRNRLADTFRVSYDLQQIASDMSFPGWIVLPPMLNFVVQHLLVSKGALIGVL